MTREEAKTFLLQLHADKQLNKTEHEALRMAIRSLDAWDGLLADFDRLSEADPDSHSGDYWAAFYGCLGLTRKHLQEVET